MINHNEEPLSPEEELQASLDVIKRFVEEEGMLPERADYLYLPEEALRKKYGMTRKELGIKFKAPSFTFPSQDTSKSGEVPSEKVRTEDLPPKPRIE